MATSDLTISMWEVGIQASNPYLHDSTLVKPDEYRFSGLVYTSAMVLTLKYSPDTNMVWAIGGHDVLHGNAVKMPMTTPKVAISIRINSLELYRATN